MSARPAAHAAPMPRAAPVTMPTVMRRLPLFLDDRPGRYFGLNADVRLRRVARTDHAGLGSIRSAVAGDVATVAFSTSAPLRLMARSSVPR